MQGQWIFSKTGLLTPENHQNTMLIRPTHILLYVGPCMPVVILFSLNHGMCPTAVYPCSGIHLWSGGGVSLPEVHIPGYILGFNFRNTTYAQVYFGRFLVGGGSTRVQPSQLQDILWTV